MFRRRLAYVYLVGAVGIGCIATRIPLDSLTRWLLGCGVLGMLFLGFDLYRMGTLELRAKTE